MNIFAPILENILGYDLLIILLAVGTLGYFFYVRWHTHMVNDFLYGYRPDDIYDDTAQSGQPISEIKEKKDKLRKLRETSEKFYTMFSNLATIFPLMGILGTVIALIPLVQELDSMEQNFFVALTSTLWGLVFAITFKILDGMLSPQIERNSRGIEEYLERLDNQLKERAAKAAGVPAGQGIAGQARNGKQGDKRVVNPQTANQDSQIYDDIVPVLNAAPASEASYEEA